MKAVKCLKADFYSPISGARNFLRLIVDLGMLTTSPEKVEVCSTFCERLPVVASQKNRSSRK